MAIEFYKEFGELGYLANYSLYGFYKDGVYYKTAEHYYQSEKFDEDSIKLRIIDADTAHDAASIGRDRSLKRKDDFRDIKLEVMYSGVLEKFRQNSDIRSKLIETRNEVIKEMTVKENYWGMGPELDGRNHMGKILEVVRERVKEELLLKIINNCFGKVVYVIGHSNPDADSVFSSVILVRILKSMGIDARVAIRDRNFADRKLINDYLKEEYEVISDYSDKDFILVDHNSLLEIDKDRVIGAIDHHIIIGEVDDLIEIEYSSTGLLIYDLFKNIYKFSEDELLLIALTVLSDTEYLTSSRFGVEDKKLYEEMNLHLDVLKYQEKYFEVTDFNMSIKDNLVSDYKEYLVGYKLIKRSMIRGYDRDKDKFYGNYILELESSGIDLLIWCSYDSLKTYINYCGKDIIFPYFTTSTNLVIKYLCDEGYL